VRLHLPWPRLTADVRVLMRRILPVALGAGVYQISLLIDTVIASLLPSGSISYLFFADRVNQLPLGVVGVAVGTALLPLLSRQLRAGDTAAATASQNRALEFSLLLSLPAAAALMVIAHPVVTVLFERGEFGPTEAQATAAALAVYASGLPAYVLVKALAPGYFARGDTATPVKISVLCLVVNLVLNLILMGPFLHVGIAAATSVSAWLNAVLLATFLRRRGLLEFDGRLGRVSSRLVLATAVMAILVAVGAEGLSPWLAGGEVSRIAALAALVVGGAVIYGLAVLAVGAVRIADLRRWIDREGA
jgi:putative peptidoglycan lipid II flippase